LIQRKSKEDILFEDFGASILSLSLTLNPAFQRETAQPRFNLQGVAQNWTQAMMVEDPDLSGMLAK